jgi:aminodeoxyfutalosine synthase
MNVIEKLLTNNIISSEIKKIAEKILNNQRITESEGTLLYSECPLSLLATLADYVNQQKNELNVYYNRNIHIEPTNICIYKCEFCSYSLLSNTEAWELSLAQIIEKVKQYVNIPITEVHIVGGVHPDRDTDYYGNMIRSIKQILPHVHVKAFTAIELEFMFKKSKLSIKEGLLKLKEYGLDSIPGGGAEIFDETLRAKICGRKTKSNDWLNIHRIAHTCGIPSNATMLYGHIEKYNHRIEHLSRLRNLQDETKGFNAFIPLKFRKENNFLSELGEVPATEDLKNYAISRIFLDNFKHIKAYWPMIGKELTQISLSFGVDDIDGTIDNSTKIYSLAGAEDKSPVMTVEELRELVLQVGKKPIERDSLYKEVKYYK